MVDPTDREAAKSRVLSLIQRGYPLNTIARWAEVSPRTVKQWSLGSTPSMAPLVEKLLKLPDPPLIPYTARAPKTEAEVKLSQSAVAALIDLRENKRYTLRKIAKLVGVSAQSVNLYLARQSQPSPETAARILRSV